MAPVSVTLMALAAVCWNLFLLASLAGVAVNEDWTTPAKGWGILMILTAFFGSNAVILDQLGKYYGW